MSIAGVRPTIVREFPDQAPPNVIFLRAADGAGATLSSGVMANSTGEMETVGFVAEVPWGSAYLGDVLTWAVRWQLASGLARLLVPMRTAAEAAALRKYGGIETVLAHVSFTQVGLPVDSQPILGVNEAAAANAAAVERARSAAVAPIQGGRRPPDWSTMSSNQAVARDLSGRAPAENRGPADGPPGRDISLAVPPQRQQRAARAGRRRADELAAEGRLSDPAVVRQRGRRAAPRGGV
mgnify:CR=1 FL=1